MKLSTLVLLVILGAIGYKIWQVATPAPPPPVVVPVAVATPAPPTSTPRPQEWPRSALTVIHGRIVDITSDGLAINITGVEAGPVTSRHITAQTVRDAQRRGEEQDHQTYGPLMTMENGSSLRPAKDIPTNKAEGMVVLKDYPNERNIAPGALINIVAAPLGSLTYTARFNTPPEDPNAWRLKYKGPMDPNPH